MPGSCDSDNSSPNLISSLRNFRFARQAKQYQPPAQASASNNQESLSNTETSAPQTPDSTSSKQSSNGSTTAHSLPTSPINTQASPSTSNQQYGPLSYRKYDSIASSQYLITCIINKFQEALKKSKSHVSELELKVSNEELKKIKDLVLTNTSVAQLWKSKVTHEEHSFNSSCEKVLRINRGYLSELIKLLKNAYNVNLLAPAEDVKKSPAPVRTYTRKPKVVNASPVAKCVEKVVPEEKSSLGPVKPKGIMDEYEVFCSKEQNLRKLLDAYPGADIMEAQDILVKCGWNLSKAMGIAETLPLRCSKKRAFSTSSVDSATSNDKTPQGISAPRTSTTSSTAEEIVLDSSDDENPTKAKSKNSKAAPSAAKRARVMSSSDTDDDDPPPVLQKNPVSVIPSNASKSTTVNLPSSRPVVVKPVTATKPINSVQVAPTKSENSVQIAVSKSLNLVQNSPSALSVQLTPSSAADNTKAIKTAAVTVKPLPIVSATNSVPSSSSSNSMPNLPKGLVITQVGKSAESSLPDTTNDSAKSSASIQQADKANTPSYTRIVTTDSNHNKSAQLVHLKSSNGVSVKPSDNSAVAQSKSLSIIPKGVSITPVANSSNSASTSNSQTANNSHQSASTSQKPKNAKGKRKKDEIEEEDDEDYGNDLIYDSEDSDIEDENLTSAHGAVLRYFQESTLEELQCIPGCSKKKAEALLNAKPFLNWGDLVAKLSTDKYLSTDMLNGAKKVLDMRSAINKLMTKCQQISFDMEDLVENLKENRESSSGYVNKQPALLNDRMHLTSYQMLGLNWLLLMHNQEVNGILADEMGLGKTVQAIAFLAYLKQISNMSGPHLIVVPSSVLDNWKQEFKAWWPDVSMIWYHGSQDSRRDLRMQILNDEVDEFDVMVTTYNMVTSSSEDRGFFKRLEFHYVVFDEAHMLKNMASQRYQHLMKIKAPRRLLLTGTPLQNNLVELMSLLIFAMPNMFSGKTEHIRQMFSSVSKSDGNKNTYEKDRIDHAKRIMKPFVLRRLKKDVLQDLPPKNDETKLCQMSEDQAQKYADLVKTFSAEVQNNQEKDVSSSGAGMMMQLRRAANHPLLLRRFYNDGKLTKMSKAILKEPTHTQSDANLVFEDMSVMSDFELHKLCTKYKSLKSHVLRDADILNSGKFKVLDSLMPSLIEEDHRILLFSQFTMVLDIVEDYMNIKKYKFLRLDGQVPVSERQQLIDEFNTDSSILVFLLSTRAGGLGINLTAADTVILHDIDFNPYNDKQAEDRCHRVGQTKDVTVIRLISENTIEEGILQRATEKLKLERDIHEEDETEENDVASVAKLLRDALGLKGKS